MVSEERFTLVEHDSRFAYCVTILLEAKEINQLGELRLVSCHELMHVDNSMG